MSDKEKDRELEAADAEQKSAEDSADAEPVEKKLEITVGVTEASADADDENANGDAAAEESSADSPGAESSAQAAVASGTAGRGGNGIAWLALLLAVVAVAAMGFTIAKDWFADKDTATDDAIARLEQQLAAARTSRDELAASIEALIAEDRDGGGEIDRLRADVDERVRLLNALPGRMTALESSVAAMAGISESSRDAWLIAEAEYYMQIANAQLQLANNPALAELALQMADERVVQMGNPGLTAVRQAIADELAALDVMEKPDIAGATMTLASLAQVVESLPLAAAATGAGERSRTPAEDQNGLQRAWASLKSALSGLVRVTPPDQAQLALISPDAEVFLRNNLGLQLQSARLALLRGEQAVFEQSIDDTLTLLERFFDADSAQVQSARATLEEVRGNVFTTSAPDISGSLQLLRQFRSLRESSQ